jgi:hypothetical protein
MTESSQEQLANSMDAALLDIIKAGVPLRDESGNAIVDESGKPIYAPASAAYFSVARARLRDCGITAVNTPGSKLDELRKEIESGGHVLRFKRPALSDDDDPATQETARAV